MQINVGDKDRIVRAVIGVILISLVFVGPKTAWGWIGALILFTSVVRWCPIYAALGLHTNKTPK